MNHTASEVLEFVEENDVKFVRLAFCDVFGSLKNISILSEELPRAFEYGITIEGMSLRGFESTTSELLLFPDPATITVLPWRPMHGRVARLFCDICTEDGRPFEGDSRAVLKRAVADARAQGYTCRIGPECEFYLFERDDRGGPTQIPMDRAGYLDVAPLDKGEDVRREICLTLEEMGITPESSHHERGPGQNEIDFKYSDALSAADNLVTLKSVVETVAAGSGYAADFHPCPLPGESCSGLHVNMSLARGQNNLFRAGEDHNREAECFLAGVLRYVEELTLFLNPLESSYQRFGTYTAPDTVSWSRRDGTRLVRIPAVGGEYARMELRSPDPMCNPYLAFALLLWAGLEGIRQDLLLEAPDRENAPRLPRSRQEAVERVRRGTLVKELLPRVILSQYLD